MTSSRVAAAFVIAAAVLHLFGWIALVAAVFVGGAPAIRVSIPGSGPFS